MAAPGNSAVSPAAPSERAAGRFPIAGFFALYFAATGITLPFLPAWFRSLGISASEIGVLLSIQPVVSLFAPPFWGYLADRTGRTDRVLSAIALGAFLCFAPLLWADRFWPIALTMTGFAFFASSISPIIDSLALQRVALHGGNYSRLRLFGSIGFVLVSAAFGLAVDRIDHRTVAVPLGLIGAYFLWTFALRARAAAVPARRPFEGLGLLRHRDLALMLIASALHWIASAPYHGDFGIHVTALGLPPWVIGVSAGLGVTAEIGVMFAYPVFAKRLAPRHVLLMSFTASLLRWLGMALVSSPMAIVTLSLLHGLSFGAFYVAAVSFVSRRVPAELRASGQALMATITFGLGGLIGYPAAGAVFQLVGGHRMFGAAAILELVPMGLILFVRSPGESLDREFGKRTLT